MKRIGIVTIVSDNMGNRLQNFAMQLILEKLGYDVETLQRSRETSYLARKLKLIIKCILRTRDWKFRVFDQKIKWSPYCLGKQGSYRKIGKRYDYFVAGSDQIWNPNFAVTTDDNFLTFAKRNQRIAYAASIGVKEIPEELCAKYKELLEGIPFLSVREADAVELVRNIAGQSATLVLDPTLLIADEIWKNIATKPKYSKSYILKYVLGNNISEIDTLISELRPGIQVMDVKEILVKSKSSIGPTEFLGLVANADLVCTDSFHATVFSALFRKPFVIFERQDIEKDMSSRINSLCTTFELHEHRYSSYAFDKEKVLYPDYSKMDQLLVAEREKSLNFLIYSLGAIEMN